MEVHVETPAEEVKDATEETTDSTERALGAAENELEHHGKDIAEHTVTLDGLKEDIEWTKQSLARTEESVAQIPAVIEQGMNRMVETLMEANKKTVEETGLTNTSPPERVETVKEEHPRTHFLHRFL